MLFQSYTFIFIFLPLVLGIYYFLTFERTKNKTAIWFLIAASIVFYTSWEIAFLPYLLLSFFANFYISKLINKAKSKDKMKAANQITVIGILLNIAALILFKYSQEIGWPSILSFKNDMYLPIGASFITFIQIIFLIEVLNSRVESVTFKEHLLLSSFFPYIMSGPIVQSSEIIPQIRQTKKLGLSFEFLLAGLMLFSIGLFKKLVIADSLAPYVIDIFQTPAVGNNIHIIDAWVGSIGYMFQLYFDFSGYSDMAIGLGFLFGIRLPLNFNSPFKATNVSMYWQRWHMSLTRFITNYLYLPLAVKTSRWVFKRKINSGIIRFFLTIFIPTMIAFIIAGIWHGNGWGFLVYGLWWGIVLSIYQAWNKYSGFRLPIPLAWFLTMLTAMIALVIFRSDSLSSSFNIIQSLFFFKTGEISASAPIEFIILLLGLAISLLLLPNSQQIMRDYPITSDDITPPSQWLRWIKWKPTPMGATIMAIIMLCALLMGTKTSQFLYYKF